MSRNTPKVVNVVFEVDPVFWTTGVDGKWDQNRGQPGESWWVL